MNANDSSASVPSHWRVDCAPTEAGGLAGVAMVSPLTTPANHVTNISIDSCALTDQRSFYNCSCAHGTSNAVV